MFGYIHERLVIWTKIGFVRHCTTRQETENKWLGELFFFSLTSRYSNRDPTISVTVILSLPLKTYPLITLPREGCEVRSIVIFVSLYSLVHRKNDMTKLHENFCACYLGPWLGHFLTTMQNVVHFRSVDDVTFSHNGANTDTGIGELFTVTRQVAPGRSLLSAIALFLPVSVLLLLCIVLFYTPTVLSELRLIITDLANFWATVVKRFALCYRTVVLSVCLVCPVCL